jgi:hypothetical protein
MSSESFHGMNADRRSQISVTRSAMDVVDTAANIDVSLSVGPVDAWVVTTALGEVGLLDSMAFGGAYDSGEASA